MGDGFERLNVVGVEDQAGDFVGLVGDERFVQEGGERQVGEDGAGGDSLGVRHGGKAGEFVAGAARGGLGENVLQVRESVAFAVKVAGVGWHAAEAPR